jgi:hypothetical protein
MSSCIIVDALERSAASSALTASFVRSTTIFKKVDYSSKTLTNNCRKSYVKPLETLHIGKSLQRPEQRLPVTHLLALRDQPLMSLRVVSQGK